MKDQNFNRRISAKEDLIFNTAGGGSKTDGFKNLIALYVYLHNFGYRCYIYFPAFTAEFNVINRGKN